MLRNMLRSLNLFRRSKSDRQKSPGSEISNIFRTKYERFKELLDSNSELAKIISDLEEKLKGQQIFGMSYLRSQSARAVFHTMRMIEGLNAISNHRYPNLYEIVENLNSSIKAELKKQKQNPVSELVLSYDEITREMVDWVGGKNANLGEVKSRVQLPIPDGFAITTRAFELFLSQNDLVDEINKRRMQIDPGKPETIIAASEDIQRLIIAAPIPEELAEAVLSAYNRMAAQVENKTCLAGNLKVALRSSAIGEDSELSFAGQYLSVLNVSREKLINTYKYIIASLYTPRAISYRLNKGIPDEDAAMSVACLEMIDSRASGVAYSRHPFNLLENHIIINAVWGLGPYAVDGVISPDTYVVEKDETFSIREKRISTKPVKLVTNPDGGLLEISVPETEQAASCLSEAQIRELARYILKLEQHYGHPQDTEWALTEDGRILILQTRPLHLHEPSGQNLEKRIPLFHQYPLLISSGAVACPGVGFGPAFHVRDEEDLSNFPEGAILIAKHSSPKFVVVMRQAQGIITDSGSVSGHMASLAREFSIPTILDTQIATSSIPNGMEITVDAFSGRVYKGCVKELMDLQISQRSSLIETPIYETLKRIAELIVPLHLTDPKSSTFTPEHCQSLHDIMRLVHEFSYLEMFQISDKVSDVSGCSVSLAAPIPLDLCIIDLGGGLKDMDQGVRKVGVDKIVSVPFKALLNGMLHEGVRYRTPRPIEIRGFLSVMSEQMLSPGHAGERFGDRSYAIISDKYLNFSSRVGYHYAIVDSYCGKTMNKNYITFSFKGGAADEVRRNRRARAIGLILQKLGFVVEIIGDRIDARFQKYEAQIIQEKLDLMGRLLQFTRQMDMLMHSEAAVESIASSFLAGNYDLA